MLCESMLDILSLDDHPDPECVGRVRMTANVIIMLHIACCRNLGT
jgi:hypothetical protein